jgi:hypothetical protein
VAPAAGEAFGCSSNPAGGSSQLTVGSWSLATSYSKLPTGELAIALSNSGFPGWALKYCAKWVSVGRPVALFASW